MDGGAGGAPQPLPVAAQPRAYGPGVRPAYESGGQGGGGTSLGRSTLDRGRTTSDMEGRATIHNTHGRTAS